jgi:hypothetical protein
MFHCSAVECKSTDDRKRSRFAQLSILLLIGNCFPIEELSLMSFLIDSKLIKDGE